MGYLTRRINLVSVLIATALLFSEAVVGGPGYIKSTVAYREVGGHKILADIYRPDDTKTRPVLVYIHGGALIVGSREIGGQETREHPEASFDLLGFAEREGYAVASIDYRLAPETKLPEIINDIEEAFRWLSGEGARQFYLDPTRVVVMGSSAGGYLTLVTGYRVHPKPRALISLYGYGELLSDWYTKPSPNHWHYPKEGEGVVVISRERAESQTDGTIISNAQARKGDGVLIYLYYRQNGIWPQEVSGFPPAILAREMAPFEPVRNVSAGYPPTLLIHGINDKDVPYEQSKLMAKQFERYGVPFSLVSIENGDHGLIGADPQQIKEAYKVTEDFIRRNMEPHP